MKCLKVRISYSRVMVTLIGLYDSMVSLGLLISLIRFSCFGLANGSHHNLDVMLGVRLTRSFLLAEICCQQVLSAKVVTNARSPGSKCYGLVTMSSSTEVTRCVSHLDCTELHGQQIYVERVS